MRNRDVYAVEYVDDEGNARVKVCDSEQEVVAACREAFAAGRLLGAWDMITGKSVIAEG